MVFTTVSRFDATPGVCILYDEDLFAVRDGNIRSTIALVFPKLPTQIGLRLNRPARIRSHPLKEG